MQNSELRSHVTEIVLPLLAAADGFLVDVVIRQEGRTCVVQVFWDTDAGVRIEQCAEVSRELNRTMELRGLVDENLRLEVSSPGIDEPLKLLRQYKKNVGREYRVRYRSTEGPKEFVGSIEAVEEDRVRFRSEKSEPVTLAFESIIESTEVLPW